MLRSQAALGWADHIDLAARTEQNAGSGVDNESVVGDGKDGVKCGDPLLVLLTSRLCTGTAGARVVSTYTDYQYTCRLEAQCGVVVVRRPRHGAFATRQPQGAAGRAETGDCKATGCGALARTLTCAAAAGRLGSVAVRHCMSRPWASSTC